MIINYYNCMLAPLIYEEVNKTLDYVWKASTNIFMNNP